MKNKLYICISCRQPFSVNMDAMLNGVEQSNRCSIIAEQGLLAIYFDCFEIYCCTDCLGNLDSASDAIASAGDSLYALANQLSLVKQNVQENKP